MSGPPVDKTPDTEVFDTWCGTVEISESVEVPDGQRLEVCGGAEIRLADDVSVEVKGTLAVDGATDTATFRASGREWRGLSIAGNLDANGIAISGARECITGKPGSAITVKRGMLTGCGRSLALENGGTFENVTILGGSSVRITGGLYAFTDTTIDLRHPTSAPDCTSIDSGEGTIDHVRFTGCHCPLHFSRSTGPVTVTNSIFDGAAIPVMLSRMTGTFTHNHFSGTGADFMDIGGEFEADVAGNYYDGGAPTIQTGDMSQFTGADDWSQTPFEDVGPR